MWIKKKGRGSFESFTIKLHCPSVHSTVPFPLDDISSFLYHPTYPDLLIPLSHSTRSTHGVDLLRKVSIPTGSCFPAGPPVAPWPWSRLETDWTLSFWHEHPTVYGTRDVPCCPAVWFCLDWQDWSKLWVVV